MKGICKKCNIIYNYVENCPNCGQKTQPINKIYENKLIFQIIFAISLILTPFASCILHLNNPFYNVLIKTISSICLLIVGFISYISISQILQSYNMLFYFYQILNFIILIYLLKYFYCKSSTSKKSFAVIYTIFISIFMLINSLIFYDRQDVKILESDNPAPISAETTAQNINKEKGKTENIMTQKTQEASLKMPPFEIVDSKLGSSLKSFATYYEDQSKENIILAAKCWNKQKGNNNIFVYFVNDKSYRIDNRHTDTEKVTAFYESTVNSSTLYFLNPDGTAYETIKIY